MKIREMAGAFLLHGGNILLMKRSENRRLAPGVWGPVGGHVEPRELGDPRATCLREVFEESGLGGQDVERLALKYLLLRREDDEIRLHYLFVGWARRTDVEDKTDEGTLHWVDLREAAGLPMTFTVRSALEHYLAGGRADEGVVTGTVGAVDGRPVMHWSPLDHWQGMA